MDSTDTGEMIVKRVSVPIGLEELMEGLVKEVLLKKPDDMYFFAAKYFSKLLLLRDKGQPKANTIRSAQSLTDQREKRFQTKIPVPGVTKQLSRQFSIRGESPMRNFDSPIVSQKPKMHDRNASKYKRRNTGPPTIPENHMNIVVRKKYSRSVSTERKRETGHSVSSTKRNTNRKESKEMQNESDEKSVKHKPGDKRNSVTKELQKNFSLMKNIPTNQVVEKIAGEKNISKKDEIIGDSKSVTETADSNGSGQSNNKIQPSSIENGQASTELHDDSGLASEKTAAPIENSSVENSKEESEDGKNISIENVVGVDDLTENDGYADESLNKNNNGSVGIFTTRNDERKNEHIDDDEKPQTMEHLSRGNLKSSDEVLNVGLKIDTSSEKSKSPSDTLDNLTMETENAGISDNKGRRSVSVDCHENDEETTNNSDFTNASKIAYNNLNELKGDSKSAEEENGEHVAGVTTNESQKTDDILEDNRKAIATEILSKEDLEINDKENIALLKNTVGEGRDNMKSELKSDQQLLESIPITHTETRETEISDETNFDGSDRNEMNNSNIKAKQRIDSEDQEIGGEIHRENTIEKKVVDDIGRLVTEKESINKEGHDGVNDSHHISVDNVQEKTNTETPLEHKIMSSEMSLESLIMEHDRNEKAENKVASDEGGYPEKRGIKEDFGKGTDHFSNENDTIGMIPNDGVDIKNTSGENHNNAITIEKPSSREHKDDFLGESFKKSLIEHEGDAIANDTSEIIIGTNSSTEENKVEMKEQVSNDHLLTGKQSNIESVSQETSNSLSDKEHNESMTNQVKDSSEIDRTFGKISTRNESTKILHNEIDQAGNEPILKIGPVKSENHIKSSEKQDISNTNSTTDKESFNNAGNESISKKVSAEDEEMRIKDCKTFDSQKLPQMSDNQSHKESNDQSIVSEPSDSLGRELNESKTTKIVSTITENSELLNDDTTSYTEEHKIESSHVNEGLPRNMSNDIETEGEEKSEIQKLKGHQDEQLTGSMELKNTDPKSDIGFNDSNEVSEDILIRKGNKELNKTETDTTEKNELFSNTSGKIEMEETAEKSVTQNVKENEEEMSSNHENLKNIDSTESELDEFKSNHHSAIRNDINPIEVSENIVIHKEMGKLTNNNTIGDGEKERLSKEKSVSTKDTGAFDRNSNGPDDKTQMMEDITLSKMINEHEHISAIDSSSGPEENLKLKNSKLDEDVANTSNDQTDSRRNKRSLEKEDQSSENIQDFDIKTNDKYGYESISDSKQNEEESNTLTNSRDLNSDDKISQPVDETDLKKISDINISDEKQEDTDTLKKKTNVGNIDKVAKNYISYVIDKENYLKYNHAENDRKEDDTTNTTNGISDDKLQSSSEEQNDGNSDIQKNDNQTSFDRLKLREELGIPSMEEPNNSDREELKRNISSTLSIAETGLIDTPAKAFINNFISNERGEQFEKKDGKANNDHIGSEERDNKNDSNPNGLQSNESFDRSKLREELQKIEQESKFTSFKQSFNSSLLRQELEHAALLKKSTKNNGYSSTLAKAAAVVRIQSMWRGFIVRKSFPKPQYDGEFSVHRDENSNVYQKKIQAPIESKLHTSSIDDKENNEDPKLMESVATIQRCWRGFKVRKYLNSMRLKQNSEESARIKTHVDDKNIDFFDTMMAAVKIQKIWRGFITRKKLNITKNLSKKCENKKVGFIHGTNGELVQNQKSPSVNTENTHINENNESFPKSHDGITIKQIDDHLPLMKNDNNGSNEDSKSVPVIESKMHGEMTSGENLMTRNTSTFPDQKSNEDDRKRINCVTKIQSLWRGFLVRKYVKQLKKQMVETRDGGTHNTDAGDYPKDESQRPVSKDSNDSSNTVIFNDIDKKSEGVKSHDNLLLGYPMIHRDFDDVDASLDEILEYPLIKDEHLIDDYQNELLDRISGKQKDTIKDPANTVETVSPKRIEEIKAEELKDVSALHTSILSNSVGQDKNESQVEQTHPRSKLERVIEESSSPTDEDPINLKIEQADGKTITTSTETEERKLSFCSEPSAPTSGTKVINGKPLSNYVEQIETKQESLPIRDNSEITQNERDGDVIEHTHSHTMEENAHRECGSASAENSQSSGLENVKLLHSGEWHDTIVIPLPKPVTESLKTDAQNGRIGHFQGSEASEKSLDSTADISSILSNASAGLLHTGEMHDGIVVPISLSSLGRTISSGGEDNGIDTIDSHTKAVQNQEVRTIDNTTSNGASSIAVQVLQAPEPEVLTSPTPVAAAGDVTRADEGRSAQTPNKEGLRIQSEVSPCVSQSMESERAGKTEEKIMEAQAATKIQAGFRGYQVRKQLKLKNGSSDMNPPKRPSRGKCPGRSDSAKSQSNRPKDVEEKSAVKIQAGVRGFLVRRRQKKQSNQES